MLFPWLTKLKIKSLSKDHNGESIKVYVRIYNVVDTCSKNKMVLNTQMKKIMDVLHSEHTSFLKIKKCKNLLQIWIIFKWNSQTNPFNFRLHSIYWILWLHFKMKFSYINTSAPLLILYKENIHVISYQYF